MSFTSWGNSKSAFLNSQYRLASLRLCLVGSYEVLSQMRAYALEDSEIRCVLVFPVLNAPNAKRAVEHLQSEPCWKFVTAPRPSTWKKEVT